MNYKLNKENRSKAWNLGRLFEDDKSLVLINVKFYRSLNGIFNCTIRYYQVCVRTRSRNIDDIQPFGQYHGRIECKRNSQLWSYISMHYIYFQ